VRDFSQMEMWLRLLLVKVSRSQPLHRSRRVIPASREATHKATPQTTVELPPIDADTPIRRTRFTPTTLGAGRILQEREYRGDPTVYRRFGQPELREDRVDVLLHCGA